MRKLLLRLRQARADSAAHIGNGDVRVLGKSTGGSGCGCGNSRSDLELLHIFPEDPALRAGALDLRQGDTTLKSDLLRNRCRKDTVSFGKLGLGLLLGGLRGLRRGRLGCLWRLLGLRR